MKFYDTLISADIYRDGGSLEARFRLADGTFESLWLQVLPWDSPDKKAYGALKVNPDANGAENGKVVPIAGEEEKVIHARLCDFLQAPKVDIPASPFYDSSSCLEKVLWLSTGLKR